MKRWIVCLVVGLCLVALGAGVGVNEDEIKCGSETMQPGDVCEETMAAGTTVETKTYEQMMADTEAGQQTFGAWGRWVLFGAGVLLTVGGAVGIVAVRRQRAAQGSGTAGPS